MASLEKLTGVKVLKPKDRYKSSNRKKTKSSKHHGSKEENRVHWNDEDGDDDDDNDDDNDDYNDDDNDDDDDGDNVDDNDDDDLPLCN